MMQETMTPQQVAEYLQMTPETVYRLIRSNQLAATRIGRHYRVLKEDLDRFMLSHSTRSEVRKLLWGEVMAFAGRHNPGLSSDDVLEDLERMDEEDRAGRIAKRKHA
jgi:excisionase family DNA binding protein